MKKFLFGIYENVLSLDKIRILYPHPHDKMYLKSADKRESFKHSQHVFKPLPLNEPID